MAQAAVLVRPIPPFLRWAGGKRWLLFQLPQLLGSFKVVNYYEPFLGAASIFLGVRPAGKVRLADLNSELIQTYAAVRKHPAEIAQLLEKYPNEPDAYYQIRDSSPRTPVRRAARFIYLNHTSYNGVYRVNLNGEYNVPYGDREYVRIPDEDHLSRVATRLYHSKLLVSDFEETVEDVSRGDLVFLDPPYTVAHNENGFIKYNQKLFSFEDQQRLRTVVDRIKERGAYYILTNAAHDSIARLFDCGDRMISTCRRNSVGGRNADRGTATEYLFTNLPKNA